jgi:BTB/POZ domain
MSPSKPTKRSEKLAPAPFDDEQADLILQSSDKVHFRVFKLVLSLASPIFADTFNIPLPPSEKPDEVQVVPLSEDSTALEVALRHIYPVRTTAPKGDMLQYASILAEFARKYQVEALDRFVTGYLTDSIESDPVGVYAIAASNGYKDIGANAARSCLNLPFSGLRSSYLRCATAEHISELFRYHVACGEAASALASSDRTWFSSLGQNKIIEYITSQRTYCGSCSMPDPIPQIPTSSKNGRVKNSARNPAQPAPPVRNGPRCLWNYLYRSALVLVHHPTAEAITKEVFVQNTNDCTNTTCVQDLRGHMLEISVVLGREIKKAIQRVSLSPCPLSRACDVQWCTLIRGRFPYPGPWTLSTGLNRVLPLPLLYTRLMIRVSQNNALL